MTDKAYYEGDILDMELDIMNVSCEKIISKR